MFSDGIEITFGATVQRLTMSINVIPHLTCRKADDAIEFYKKAFGAEQSFIQRLPDGRVMHGAVTLSGTPIYLVEEFEEFGGKSPLALGGPS
jgi:uncharacterized glyoxalase superfamily protein PhnB